MPAPAGRHAIGPDRGRVLLRTYRQGLAASAGHDLVVEFARWSAELTVDGSAASGLTAVLDMSSFTVIEGTGGVKPLSDRDKREIAATARKQLSSDRFPEARFTSTAFTPDESGGGTVSGTLTLVGKERPFTLTVTSAADERYHASGQVVQSEFGIKPYSGFFGALKLRDAVDVEIDLELSGLGGAG